MPDRRALLLVLPASAVLAGCPGPAVTDDAASPMPDAFTATMPDAFMAEGTDAFRPDMPDAFVAPMPDAFVPGDAGPDPLPPITDPTAHLVPASADGHDRLFGVTFAPDSSFYVVGVRAAGTAATDDFETIVGHFTPAGDLDTSFGTGGWFVRNLAVGLGGEVTRGVALQSDGKIVVASTIEHVEAGADARDRDVAVFRLSTDGTLDTSFGTAGITVLDLSDGEAVPAPGTGYAADSAWNVSIDGMDRVLVAVGLKRDGATDTDFGVARLASSGALDTSFAGDGVYSLDLGNVNASVREVHALPDGRVAASGYYNDGTSVRPVLYVLDGAGAPVAGFGTMGVYDEVVLTAQTEIYGFAAQGGAFVTAGYGRELGPEDNDFVSIRIDVTTGVRDLTYGGGDGVAVLEGYDFGDNARDMTLLPDGRVLMIGALRTSSSASDAALVLLSRDGVPDATFGTGGVMLSGLAGGTVDHYWAVDVDPRGERVVVVGVSGTDPATDDDGLVYLLPVP